MYESLSTRILKRVGCEQILNTEELEIAQYNLSIILINLGKMLVVYSVALLARTVLFTLIMHLTFILLRRYAGGWHARTSKGCTIVSLLIFVGIPKLAILFSLLVAPILYYSVLLYILLSVYRYAPADTEANPLVSTKQRKTMRIKSIIVVSGCFFIPLVMSNIIQLAVLLGLLLETMTIHPQYYSILKRSYNNYENYEEYEEIHD